MPKKPTTKMLSTCDVTSSVKLAIGDEMTDVAEVSVRFELSSSLDEGRRYSSGLQFSIVLPEGSVLADADAAKAMARDEAAVILRKMAASVAKPPAPK